MTVTRPRPPLEEKAPLARPGRAPWARGPRRPGHGRAGFAFLALLAISGCLGGETTGSAGAPVSSAPPGAISVTALPDPGQRIDQAVAQAGETGASDARVAGEAAHTLPGAAPSETALPELARRPPPRRPGSIASATSGTSPAARPAAPPAVSGPPPLPVPTTVFGQQMQEQARKQCTAAGGRLARRGSSDALSCFIQPSDAGKRCTRKSDCQGQCLARSGTCAPVIPLLGCQEVLLDSGLRVTQCLE